jgi:hypothetical protein
MGIAVGDHDRDSWFDYFYTNIHRPLLLHNGGGTFTDVTAAAGLDQDVVPGTGNKRVTWGTIFFDYDLDSFLDLCVAAGTLGASSTTDPQPNLLYHNDGNGISFTDVSASSGFNESGRSRTVVMGDYDRDGDPDLFLVDYGEKALLFRNDYANTTAQTRVIGLLRSPAAARAAHPRGRTTIASSFKSLGVRRTYFSETPSSPARRSSRTILSSPSSRSVRNHAERTPQCLNSPCLTAPAAR